MSHDVIDVIMQRNLSQKGPNRWKLNVRSPLNLHNLFTLSRFSFRKQFWTANTVRERIAFKDFR